MATVPRYDLPTVQSIPAIGTSESEVGGERVGAAIQGLAGNLDKFGGVLAQHAVVMQGLQNEASAKDAMTEYATKSGALTAQYNSLEGKNAVDGHDKYVTDLAELRQQIKNNLPNAEAARMFDQVASRQENYSIQASARYAASQNKAWLNDSSVSRVASLQDSVLQHPNDDNFFAQTSAAIDAEVQSQGELHGWSADTIKAQQQMAHGKAWANRIGQVALNDPLAASKMFEENSDKIDGPNQLAIEKVVHDAMDTHGTRQVASSIINGQTPGPASAGINWDAYEARAAQIESSGSATAKAKSSSALGRDQFTKATFNAFLAARHPELLATGKDYRTDPALSKEGAIWLGQQNAAMLAKAGLPVNAGTVYLAHFLGGQGAIDMMKASPMRTGASINPAAAKANPTIFYNKDGSAKGAGEIVAWAAQRMGGPLAANAPQAESIGPLTPQSDGKWLAAARELAQGQAQSLAPGNAIFADTLQARILSAYNNVQHVKEQNEQANFNTVQAAITNVGGQMATDPEEIIGPQAPQTVREAFFRLPPPKQQGLLKQITENASRLDAHPTDAQEKNYMALTGEQINNPAAYAKENLQSYDLTPKQLHDLTLEQVKEVAAPPKAISYEHAAFIAKPLMAQAGITFDTKTKAHATDYNAFLGELNQALLQKEGSSKRVLSDQDIRETVAGLIRQTTYGNRGIFGGLFGNTSEEPYYKAVQDAQVFTLDQAKALPSGTIFKLPDGRLVRKK